MNCFDRAYGNIILYEICNIHSFKTYFLGKKKEKNKSIFWSSFYVLGTVEGPEKSPGRLWESLRVYILNR